MATRSRRNSEIYKTGDGAVSTPRQAEGAIGSDGSGPITPELITPAAVPGWRPDAGSRIGRLVGRSVDVLLVVTLATEVGLLFVNVVLREVFNTSLLWV